MSAQEGSFLLDFEDVGAGGGATAKESSSRLARRKEKVATLRLLGSFFHPFSLKNCCSTWASLLSFFPAPLLHSIPPTSNPPMPAPLLLSLPLLPFPFLTPTLLSPWLPFFSSQVKHHLDYYEL